MSKAHPVDIHVGKRLRMRRNVLGMSQEELGRSVGITFQQIQKYERGVNRVGSSRLYEFSQVLKVPVAFFFENFVEEAAHQMGFAEDRAAYDAGAGGKAADPLSDKETLTLVRSFNKIGEQEVRNKILALVKSLEPK